jgi:hypothetical protein
MAEHPLQKLERELLGTPMRDLDLCGLHCQVSRIGYGDEGLRLTLSVGMPYEFETEVKLSRADAMWLRDALTAALVDPRNENMPTGKQGTDG